MDTEEDLRRQNNAYTFVPNVRIGQADFSPFGKPILTKQFPYGVHNLSASDFPDHSCWGVLYKEVKNWDDLSIREKISDKMPAVSLELRTDAYYNRPPTECTYHLPSMTPKANLLFPFNGFRYERCTLSISTTIDPTKETDRYNCVVGMAFFDFANREIGW